MAATAVRHPAVAGRFYPSDPEVLRRRGSQIPHSIPVAEARSCLRLPRSLMPATCIPGMSRARFLRKWRFPNSALSCARTTLESAALWRSSVKAFGRHRWATFLSTMRSHAALKQRCVLLRRIRRAPQRARDRSRTTLPANAATQTQIRSNRIGDEQFEVLEQLGDAIADVIAAQNHDVLIVASSDMNHYESDAITRVKDQRAIKPILNLDAHALYDVVTQQHISMCGFGPAVAMLTATKKLGANRAELVKYATSGDISGDRDLVVGYAGIIVPAT